MYNSECELRESKEEKVYYHTRVNRSKVGGNIRKSE